MQRVASNVRNGEDKAIPNCMHAPDVCTHLHAHARAYADLQSLPVTPFFKLPQQWSQQQEQKKRRRKECRASSFLPSSSSSVLAAFKLQLVKGNRPVQLGAVAWDAHTHL